MKRNVRMNYESRYGNADQKLIYIYSKAKEKLNESDKRIENQKSSHPVIEN